MLEDAHGMKTIPGQAMYRTIIVTRQQPLQQPSRYHLGTYNGAFISVSVNLMGVARDLLLS